MDCSGYSEFLLYNSTYMCSSYIMNSFITKKSRSRGVVRDRLAEKLGIHTSFLIANHEY